MKIYLHGSFAETYKGHKTDVAVVGGLLGYTPENEEIPFSFHHAEEKGMAFTIETRDLGSDYHPNSVLIEIYDPENASQTPVFSLIGSSIGGGNIEIVELDGIETRFDGDSSTLIEIHQDQKGVLAKIMEVISILGYNVKEMHLSRKIRSHEALTWIELDKPINQNLINLLKKIKQIKKLRWLNV